MREGDEGRQQPGAQRCQWPAQLRQHRGEAAGNVGDAAGDGLGADRRELRRPARPRRPRERPAGAPRRRPGRRGRRRKGPRRPAAGRPARRPHLAMSVAQSATAAIGVRIGKTRARPLHHDNAQAELGWRRADRAAGIGAGRPACRGTTAPPRLRGRRTRRSQSGDPRGGRNGLPRAAFRRAVRVRDVGEGCWVSSVLGKE